MNANRCRHGVEETSCALCIAADLALARQTPHPGAISAGVFDLKPLEHRFDGEFLKLRLLEAILCPSVTHRSKCSFLSDVLAALNSVLDRVHTRPCTPEGASVRSAALPRTRCGREKPAAGCRPLRGRHRRKGSHDGSPGSPAPNSDRRYR